MLVGGYKLVVPRGYEFEVSRLGKIATWGLYASIGLVLVTEEGTWWPLACFWINLALAVIAAGQYVVKARRTVRSERRVPTGRPSRASKAPGRESGCRGEIVIGPNKAST